MKKTLLYIAALLLSTALYSCSNNDNEPDEVVKEPAVESPLANLDHIITITEGIGNWDEAYLTPNGYFCFANSLAPAVSAAGRATAEPTDDQHALLYFRSDGVDRTTVSIIMQQDTHLPIEIVFENAQAEFCYLTDDVVEVIWSDNTGSKLVSSLSYDKVALLTEAATSYDNNLQRTLYYFCAIVSKIDLGEYPALAALLKQFEEVISYIYDPDVKDVTVDVTKDENGDYEFVVDASHYATTVVSETCYTITLWTGDASFKVGGSSCTLGGAVYCSSPTFRDLGTYGVVIDTDAANLTVDKAQYVKQAYQAPGELSYEVDFRGFRPNTTYYYRSYYKFNTSDHGSLAFKYGDKNAEVGYDTTVKSFTTGDNNLFVDVVMCIDVTGSMYDIINTVKTNAMEFYDIFDSRCAELEIGLTGMNIQVFAYQDINVDGDRAMMQSETYSMPDQKEAFKGYVSGLYADGGGDIPESGLEVLMNAFSKEDFSVDDGYHRQVVILWTDAPYLLGDAYTSLTPEMVEAKWNTLPSGRRLILFAPSGNGYSNGGSWDVMDSWTNCMHYTDTGAAFSDITVSIDAIIGELTSGEHKAALVKANRARRTTTTYFAPNK